MRTILIAVIAFTIAAAAASIDGKWTAEVQTRGRAGAPQPQKVQLTLDLKSAGDQLTGSVATATRRGDRQTPIAEGKVDGDTFSFTTIQKNRRGEVKMKWSGTVKGDEITGERNREGAKRGVTFTAKRKS